MRGEFFREGPHSATLKDWIGVPKPLEPLGRGGLKPDHPLIALREREDRGEIGLVVASDNGVKALGYATRYFGTLGH